MSRPTAEEITETFNRLIETGENASMAQDCIKTANWAIDKALKGMIPAEEIETIKSGFHQQIECLKESNEKYAETNTDQYQEIEELKERLEMCKSKQFTTRFMEAANEHGKMR
jgi:hypothetical protein